MKANKLKIEWIIFNFIPRQQILADTQVLIFVFLYNLFLYNNFLYNLIFYFDKLSTKRAIVDSFI